MRLTLRIVGGVLLFVGTVWFLQGSMCCRAALCQASLDGQSMAASRLFGHRIVDCRGQAPTIVTSMNSLRGLTLEPSRLRLGCAALLPDASRCKVAGSVCSILRRLTNPRFAWVGFARLEPSQVGFALRARQNMDDSEAAHQLFLPRRSATHSRRRGGVDSRCCHVAAASLMLA